jgi:hypothetical protein
MIGCGSALLQYLQASAMATACFEKHMTEVISRDATGAAAGDQCATVAEHLDRQRIEAKIGA